jgi:hypothetical protein
VRFGAAIGSLGKRDPLPRLNVWGPYGANGPSTPLAIPKWDAEPASPRKEATEM